MRVLGIDAALRQTGVTLANAEEGKGVDILMSKTIPTYSKNSDQDCIIKLQRELTKICQSVPGNLRQQPGLVIVEDPYKPKLGGKHNAGRAIKLGALAYATAINVASMCDREVLSVPVDTWKDHFGLGKRVGAERSVQMAKQYAEQCFPSWKFNTQNEIDSTLMILWWVNQQRINSLTKED
jgi:Holliday junction resolvasome RuvABC endonuclease subunit